MPNVPKKIPMRRCLGCMQMKPKSGLIRVVRSPDGNVCLDSSGKLPGRGAYICNDPACLAKAVKAGRIKKEFGTDIPNDLYDRMEEQIKKHG